MTSRTGPQSAAQRVYDWVRARILDGTYAGGTLLSEGEVAEAVGTSRTPVREAFLQLAAQEMLVLYPKRGALVLSVNIPELRDVLTARALVEPWAAALVARYPERASIVTELRRLTEQATQALASGEEAGFQEADRAFHHWLLAATGNRLLTTFYASLRDRQLRSGALALRNNPGRGAKPWPNIRPLPTPSKRATLTGPPRPRPATSRTPRSPSGSALSPTQSQLPATRLGKIPC